MARTEAESPRAPDAELPGPAPSPRAIVRARRRRAAARAWAEYRRNRLGMVGFAVLVLFIAVAVLTPVLVPSSELDVTRATGVPFSPPSAEYPFGTDESGRSVLALTLWGSRVSLLVGFLATVISVLIEAIHLHEQVTDAAADARVGELLEQVGLPARRAASYPHELSGGQRQRVMIAMALACSPRLLIADEPTTALDVMVQAQVLDLLGELRRELGLALLLITHDLSVLASTCERIAVMYAGRVIEEGPADAIFDHPAHPYTRALAEAFPTIGDRASRKAPHGLGGDPPDPRELPGGCEFHPRCPVAIPACPTLDVELWPAGPGRRAACVHVRDPQGSGRRGPGDPEGTPRTDGPGRGAPVEPATP